MGANLIPIVDTDPRSLHIDSGVTFQPDHGDVKDGCVEVGHTYKLLRFTFRTRNIGNAPFEIGIASRSNPAFEWSNAHQHLHMRQFNQYRLFDALGNLAIPSKKPGFCVIDVNKWDPNAGPKKYLNCAEGSLMGVSPGWEDVYDESLGCQYLVLRDEAAGSVLLDVPDGDYTLVYTTNSAHLIPEDSYDDNTACVGLRLAGDGVTPIDPPRHVDLQTASLVFNDVPEGETAARAVVFTVRACHSTDFAIDSGPTVLSGPPGTSFGALVGTGSVGDQHDVLPRSARIWISYKGTAPGDSATGTVRVKCVPTGQTWDVPIVANTIKRPTVAVVLTLDQSGSMALPAGTGAKRIEVLHEAASQFMQLIQANNGIGLVRFDQAAYPDLPVQQVGEGVFDPVRAQATIHVQAIQPAGTTSIGNGLELARNTVSAATGYDQRALVVFTDGLENTAKFIKDVSGTINDRTFAIGLGTAEEVSASALTALTNGTGGYLLLSGHLTANLDDYFRLSKYFLQILAGVTNTNVVVDPSGYLVPGVLQRIPFTLTEADIDTTVVLLTPSKGVAFGIETPDGDVILPSTAVGLGGDFGSGTNMMYFRLPLPVPVGPDGAHAGVWSVLLELRGRGRELEGAYREGAVQAAPYCVTVQAYSNLRLKAAIAQGSVQPGSSFTVRAKLTEDEMPIENANVSATVESPEGSLPSLALKETAAGEYEASQVAATAGVYRLRVLANGWTARGKTFTREQALSAGFVAGGDSPPLPSDAGASGSEMICELLACLIGDQGIALALKEHGVDVARLERCVRAFCEQEQRRLLEREGVEQTSSKPSESLTPEELSAIVRALQQIRGST